MNRTSRSSRQLALAGVLVAAIVFPVGAQGAAMKRHPAMKHPAMKHPAMKHHKKHRAMKHHAMKHGK